MNANEVLIDLLEDNRRRLRRVFEAMSDECLQWQPEAAANNIAVTVWHMGRIFDFFLTRQAKGEASEAEGWFRYGWAEQTGYDPRGAGHNGWGILTGYTQEEVAKIPRLSRAQMLGYLDQVYDAVKAYLESTPAEALQTPGAGWEGKYTRYQCIQMALMDNVRHLGEIYALKSMWERHNQAKQMSFTGICLLTRDVEALAQFYAKALGVQAEGDATHVDLHTQGAHISIFSSEGMEQMAPGSMQGAGYGSVTLGFEVTDVDAEYERLKTPGVEFIMLPRTHPWGARSFWFRDPDGNVVDFYTVVAK